HPNNSHIKSTGYCTTCYKNNILTSLELYFIPEIAKIILDYIGDFNPIESFEQLLRELTEPPRSFTRTNNPSNCKNKKAFNKLRKSHSAHQKELLKRDKFARKMQNRFRGK